MVKEVEVKVLNVDLESIEGKLKGYKAQLIAKEEQRNIIFDGRSSSQKIKDGDYLRIRETRDLINNKIHRELTFKKFLSTKKLRKSIETNVKIDSVDSMIDILDSLGYKVIEDGRKFRKSYMYKNIRFDLDLWDKNIYPYPYLEIEVTRPEDLEEAIKILNIDRKNISTKSIMELKEEL